MKYIKAEILVGLFVLLGILASVVLALKVAGLVLDSNTATYRVYAKFENIGSLRIRAPVRIGGVLIGRVTNISLDNETLTPVVELSIENQYNKLSSESKASIQTAGIIGEQYISITPGFYDEDMGSTYLKEGDHFVDTGSAIVLEDLISKFVFNSSQDKKDSDAKEEKTVTE
ncbi:MAG: outer membrane lipid asymmetry maintenance protein MlaD [Aeromonadales bacterium]|nr:outer membrane lipid asymmetry maintenance protein MlaD [Aeromonadales bacterium]